MRILVNKLYEASIQRPDGTSFTLCSDTRQGLKDLLAMWQQPLETWNGEFKTHTQLASSKEETVSITIEMERAS